MTARAVPTIATVVAQLRDLGVRPGVLVVHTSYRAVRPIEDGPLGLIQALLAAVGPAGTLVMPTMTAGNDVFDPTRTPTLDMGVTAELFWRQPGVQRSTHPGGSFAARGPQASLICAPQPLSPPHGVESPVGRAHQLGGQILLLGVGHSANTSLHLAEDIAKVPYSVTHPCVALVDGQARTIAIAETDHCCEGFEKVDHLLDSAGLQRRGPVGSGDARLCDAADLVDVAVGRLREDPLWFLCPPGHCRECDAAHRSV